MAAIDRKDWSPKEHWIWQRPIHMRIEILLLQTMYYQYFTILKLLKRGRLGVVWKSMIEGKPPQRNELNLGRRQEASETLLLLQTMCVDGAE